jgi:SAM-dependent methyltransferase
MDTSSIHQNNAAYWDGLLWYNGDEANSIEFLRAGGNYLFESEKALLGDISSWCKRAIHLQCSHGNDVLSLLRQGAAEAIGVDISERLLGIAARKAEAVGVNARWVCSDILETPHDLDSTADLVYTGKGALCWMMDIDAWARVVARLLKPGGLFFVHEGHPLNGVWNIGEAAYVLDEADGDYFSGSLRSHLFSRGSEGGSPQYRQWTLGQIINSLIAAGLTIEYLMEHPEEFYPEFWNMPPETIKKLPHTFTVMARKA